MFKRILFLLVFVLLFMLLYENLQYTSHIQKDYLDDYEPVFKYEGSALYLSGMILPGHVEKIVYENPEEWKNTQLVIFWNHVGGSMLEAYDMAQLIHDDNKDTMVVGDCASACVDMYIAGRHRHMYGEKSRLGVHRMYNPRNVSTNTDLERGQMWVFIRWAFYDDMGVDGTALTKRTIAQPSDGMYWIGQSEASTIRGIITD